MLDADNFCIQYNTNYFLHNWLANHTDSVRKLPDNGRDQVAKTLFNCHCDSIVAESPFIAADNIILVVPRQQFTVKQNCSTVYLPSSPHFYASLRGPPDFNISS